MNTNLALVDSNKVVALVPHDSRRCSEFSPYLFQQRVGNSYIIKPLFRAAETVLHNDIFRKAISHAAKSGEVVVDFEVVTDVSCAMVASCMMANRVLRKKGSALVVKGANQQARDMFVRMGLVRCFEAD